MSKKRNNSQIVKDYIANGKNYGETIIKYNV